MIDFIADQKIIEALERIYKETQPLSIFVYGSRARNDFLSKSDYEIGVIYKGEDRPTRAELEHLYDPKLLRVYPFVYEDLMSGNPDTPFPKQHYLLELNKFARTIVGEDILSKITPTLNTSDLLEVVYFELGYAVSSLLSYRAEDQVTATITFHKSVLFGARAYLYVKYGEFPGTYNEIANNFVMHSEGIEERYVNLVRSAIAVRSGEEIDKMMLYTNISFLNKDRKSVV